MKISQRLMLLVATALIALIAVATVDLYETDAVYDAANFANVNTVPSLAVLNRSVMALGRLRIRVYRYVLIDDREERAKLMEKVEEAHGQLDQAMKDYEPLAADAEDRRLFEAERTMLTEYYGSMRDALRFAGAGDRAGAIGSLAKDAQVAQKITLMFDEHVAYNIKLGLAGAEAGLAAKHRALWLGIGVLVLAAVALAIQGTGTVAVVRRQLERANAAARRIASGDLRRDDHESSPGKDEIGELLQSMEGMRQSLSQTLEGVIGAANSLKGSASTLSSASQQAAASSQQQSQATAEAAAGIEELSTSIDQVGASARDANAYANSSRQLAITSGGRVADASRHVGDVAGRVEFTAQQVSGLSVDVQEIGKITTVIREVAEQTNLLALNAAIEAARAGEQGRGFAVVADEVRKLAERTTSSVQSISAVIQRIQNGSNAVVTSMDASRGLVGDVVASAQASGLAMQEIVSSVDTLRQSIEAISFALTEQQTASIEVSRNVESIAHMADETAASSATVSATATELLSLADSLHASVASFRL